MAETDSNLEKPQPGSCASPAVHPSQQCSSLWTHGTLTLPELLLVKMAGSTHFPVFFCQLWEKALISFLLPPRHWPWRRCEKPSLRVTALRHVPSRQRGLLSPLFVSLEPAVLLRMRNKNLSHPFLESFRRNKYCLISCHLFVLVELVMILRLFRGYWVGRIQLCASQRSHGNIKLSVDSNVNIIDYDPLTVMTALCRALSKFT